MLEVKDLVAGYGTHTVLQGVSTAFSRGELTSVIGKNGCGKSTLLKAMLGFLPHAHGEILLDGAKLSSRQRKEIARRIAYLAQGRDTPDMTVERMVLHGRFPHIGYPRSYGERDRLIARAAMERMGILSLADSPLDTLSGGMRQRAALIRTLAVNPDVLLLDEPFSALDYQTRLSVCDDVYKIIRNERKTALLITHDISEAISVADKAIVLSKRPATVVATHDVAFPESEPLKRRENKQFSQWFELLWKELNV